MPELPEVETVARDLQRWIAGAQITGVEVRWDRTIRHPLPPGRFAEELRGAVIKGVGRRAKSVLIQLADGRVMTVALHMTGALLVAEPGTPDDRYARVVFRLADGRELRYRDVRKFGRIGLFEGGSLSVRRVAGRRAGAGAHRRRARVREATAPYRQIATFTARPWSTGARRPRARLRRAARGRPP